MYNLLKQNHPKGLFLLFFLEMWERFAYYGMRALLVLYMVQQLMHATNKAGQIYGLYTGFVYLTPILGGWIADRFWGQRKCVALGGILMCLGLFMLASGVKSLFLISLFVMIIANGFFKSNISSILGILYGDNNGLKDSGYTIFYMGINLGAFLSPLVCGTIAVKYGFEYGFAAAGVGMLIGLVCYKIFGNKYLGDAGKCPIKRLDKTNNVVQKNLNTLEKQRLGALFILMIFTVVFFVCFEQAGSSLTFFALYSTDRNFLGHIIPVSYFQSLNPLFIIIFAPLLSVLWGVLQKRNQEPSSVLKFTISLFLISFAFMIMTFGAINAARTMVSLWWLVVAYYIMTIAELCISPIGLSLVSKLAPRQFLSLIMGCWFLTSFFGNLFAGLLGGEYEKMGAVQIFALLAVISLISGIILALFSPKLKKIMGDV